MDYNKMSDGEISVRIAYFLKYKYSATINQYNNSGAELSWNWCNTVQTTGYFPLSRANEIFPSIKKLRIGITPAGKTTWKAEHESGLSATHRNPLRAAAIVFLLIKESKNVKIPAERDS